MEEEVSAEVISVRQRGRGLECVFVVQVRVEEE